MSSSAAGRPLAEKTSPVVAAALGIGSNIDPVRNIRRAVASLRELYADVRVSPVYESKAMGFEGDNFLNLVALVELEADLGTLVADCKQLEDRHGRDRSAARFSSRSLDIDVLTYADLVGEFHGVLLPRPEITQNAFVLRPLADLLGAQVHQPTGLSYGELWERFDKGRQPLRRIDFDWQE